jgi:integrase
MAIQTLFTFAAGQRYLRRDWNEMDAVSVWKTPNEEVEIFTSKEISALLEVAGPKMVPFLAIGAFAGLRTAEIERLNWSDVDFASGYIRVTAAQAKTGSRRLVPLMDNLRSWLLPYARGSGPIIELANLANGIQRLIRKFKSSNEQPAGRAKWKHNGLRHSFCSYRLAIVKNAAQVALEAGNSPQMIFQHYRELVTEREANDWFSTIPN